MRSFGKWLGRLLLLLIVLLAGAWLFGPREPVDTTISFDPAAIGDDPDAYLAAQESRFDDITPGVEKRINWYENAGQKTPVALVYLHGYSATSEEIRPVPDQVAEALHANIYYARLTGHGRPGEALAQATAGDWIEDLAQAMAIGRRIGDKVVIISTSTGGTLATVGAAEPDLSAQLAGVVFVSPNYKVRSPAAALLSMPFARSWVSLVAGQTISWEPSNELHAKFWTSSYPTVALLPMQALVDYVADIDVSAIRTPALFIYSPEDQVVDETVTAAKAKDWGGPVQVEIRHMGPNDDPNSHVIAGEALSPSQTDETAAIIARWIEGL